jgi:hypothetical protein
MKTGKFCPHCGQPLLKSRIKGYSFQCLACNEDFCRFEVLRKKDLQEVKALRKEASVTMYNKWWNSSDFITMEKITRFRQFDFDPDEGYQAFVDACDEFWENLSTEDKKEIWEEYG